jgi:hypothetical protein
MRPKRCSSVFFFVLALFAGVSALPTTAQIQVDSANPGAAPQGTINLDVAITGNGFQKGAKAQWFVTGTTNPGGVTVNSTTFKGSTQLTANITVAPDAVISGFDIVVTNANGRTGKGTDKFAVTLKGTPIGCTTSGTSSGFTLVTQLNPVQPNGAALITTGRLGNAIRVRPLDLNGDHVVDTLLAFVASGGYETGVTYAFLLDPVTGQIQARNPVTGASWQNPLVLLSGVRANLVAVGDVNGDGFSDFVMAGDATYLFVGNLSGADSTSPYTPSYTSYRILPPAGAPGYWGIAAAVGDLDGDGTDEIALGARPAKGDKSLPAVFIFKYMGGGPTYVRQIKDPTGSQSTNFGSAIAIGNINGSPGNELVVGAYTANTNGLVHVFPYPAQQLTYFSLSGPGPNFGQALGIADVNLDGVSDLVVMTANQALIYPGNVYAGESYTSQLLPASGLTAQWAIPNSDMGEMLTAGAIAVGAPDATNSQSCLSSQGGVGAVHLFTSPFTASQYSNYLFGPPDLIGSAQFGFGYGVGLVPGYPFLLVGEHFRDVGTTPQAGQVYVYKKN